MSLADWHDQENILLTASMAAELSGAEQRHVAEYLLGLLNREPLRSGKGWGAERLVLGSLATELDIAAQAKGEPRALHSNDNRSAEVRRRERDFIEYDRHVSSIVR